MPQEVVHGETTEVPGKLGEARMRPTQSLLLFALVMAGCAISGGQSAQRPALDDERLGRVGLGMTRDDALRLIGAPDERMKFPLSGTEAWDYRYQDAWGYFAVFSVTFAPDGRVVGRISQRLNDGGDHGK